DLGTNKEQSIKITSSTKLSKDEIEKFVKEAEQFAADDQKNKEAIEAKNEADNLVYSTEKSLKEHGEKISQDERLAIDRAISDVKEALKGTDVEAIKAAKEKLSAASPKLAEVIYKDAQAKQAPQSGAEGCGTQNGADCGGHQNAQSAPQDNVVDAEVVEDDKK
ncbi:MAG: Hsp70 family protein, partial [Elusimicrobia bacterium]|nr:Hsp70 family protein [Elusimicrobiota bacterium]